MKFTINRNALKAVSRFAAKKDFRFNGVFVESNPTETRIVATDGNALCVHRASTNENESTWSGILPIDSVNALLKMKTAIKHLKWEPITITLQDNGKLRADWNNQSINFRPVDGTFPDYRRTIPETITGEPANYKPEYLRVVKDAANDIGITNYSFGYNGDKGPALAVINENMIALVMPLKIGLLTDATGASWATKKHDVPETVTA